MKPRLLSLLLLCFLVFSLGSVSYAQQTAPPPQDSFWSKVRFGGGLGLNFTRNATNITISPSALYQPNPYVAFGPGLNYTYQKFGDFKTTLIGGSAIVLANPISFLQLSGELEQVRVNQSISGEPDIPGFWNTALFVGAGYRLSIGGRGLGSVGIRYNLLFNNGDGIYADAWQPFVRVYF